jgi:HSP20 family protein
VEAAVKTSEIPEDASVEVRGRRVIVSGERKERECNGIFRTKARVAGRFRYDAVLPGDIDADAVTASYEDGVLLVRAPKPESERSKARKIEIK